MYFFVLDYKITLYFLDISYGTSEVNIVSNRSFPLDSTLIYNGDDKILFYGYITQINISLYQYFDETRTKDYAIHYVTIFNDTILSRLKLTPTFGSLLNSFQILPWELVVKPGCFLGVATDSGDLSSVENDNSIGNRISATQTGKTYLSSNYFYPYSNIALKVNGENLGIALSFVVAHSSKSFLLYFYLFLNLFNKSNMEWNNTNNNNTNNNNYWRYK